MYKEKSKPHISSNQQHDFRPDKLTVTISVLFTSYILGSFDNNNPIDVIFTDSRKHFDTVDHGFLMNELKDLGAGNLLLAWLNSYIVSKMQVVKIYDIIFELHPFSSCVSQGSHLTHLIFIVFINSIGRWMKKLKFSSLPLTSKCILE